MEQNEWNGTNRTKALAVCMCFLHMQGKSEYLLLATGLWVILVKFLFFACELLCKSRLCLNGFIIA